MADDLVEAMARVFAREWFLKEAADFVVENPDRTAQHMARIVETAVAGEWRKFVPEARAVLAAEKLATAVEHLRATERELRKEYLEWTNPVEIGKDQA